MHWLLRYELVDDYLERRVPLRQAHLARAREAQKRGELRLAGALDDPADEAVLVFLTDDIAVVEDFTRNDPYVNEGLVKSWTVRRWNVVIGTDAPG